MNFYGLIRNTNAYKIFLKDKLNSTLSHAYLIISEDGETLEDYAKIFATTLMSDGDYNENSRVCKLINSRTHSDVHFFPNKDGKLSVADADEIIRKSMLKPLESDKKLFVLLHAEDMNVQTQNKLLKTLEEPPENTYIIITATSHYSLLTTILSRVKRLDITPFTDNEIINFLSGECEDSKKLYQAVALSNGKVGECLKRYKEESNKTFDLAIDILLNLKSSKDVFKYSSKLNKENLADFVSITSRLVRDIIAVKSGIKNKMFPQTEVLASEMTNGSLFHLAGLLKDAEKSLEFNGNVVAIVDSILFGFLEGKHKWQKL